MGLAAWLLTYALHSTLILGGVWLITRRGPLADPVQQALLWRVAVLAGVVTATVQTGLALANRPMTAATWVEGEIRQQLRTGVSTSMETEEVLLALRAAPTVRGSADHVIREAKSGEAGPVAAARCRVAIRGLASDLPGGGVEGWKRGGAVPGAVDRMARACGSAHAPVAAWAWWLLGFWAVGGLGALCVRRRAAGSVARLLDAAGPAPESTEGVMGRLVLGAGVRHVRLLASDALTSPVALTGRRVVIPARAPLQLKEAELEAALAHELGHVVRRDPAWLRVFGWVETVFFFQPLNRVARRGFIQASEFLADAWAVGRTGNPLGLARSLETVSSWAVRRPPPAPVLAMARRESPVVARVRRILDAGVSTRAPASYGSLAWALLLPALLLPPVRVPMPVTVTVVVRQVGGIPPGPATLPTDGSVDWTAWPEIGSDTLEATFHRVRYRSGS